MLPLQGTSDFCEWVCTNGRRFSWLTLLPCLLACLVYVPLTALSLFACMPSVCPSCQTLSCSAHHVTESLDWPCQCTVKLIKRWMEGYTIRRDIALETICSNSRLKVLCCVQRGKYERYTQMGSTHPLPMLEGCKGRVRSPERAPLQHAGDAT